MPESLVRFSVGELDLEKREVRGAARVLPLTPRQAAFLSVLAARPGEPVSQEIIGAEVWPDQPNLSAGSIHQLAFAIRRILTEAELDPNVVETVPRKRYRLAVEKTVSAVEVLPESASEPYPANPAPRRLRPWLPCWPPGLLPSSESGAGSAPHAWRNCAPMVLP